MPFMIFSIHQQMSELHSHTKLNYKDYNWKGKTFLVADDDLYSCMLLSKILDKTGANVYCASDGREALELIKKHPEINIALLDIIMPAYSGYEIVHEAQKIRPDILYIACTADVFRVDPDFCRDLGFSAWITKPFLPVKLFRTICEAMELNES